MVETRRDVMIGALAGATAMGLGGLEAQAQTVTTRYSATSPQGKAMLAKYAKAVDIMRNKIPVGDPRHWNFQWYTHWIPGSSNWNQAVQIKNQFLQQVYGSQPSPNRDLAQAMWDSCQPHSRDPGDPTRFQGTFFLPWHRWFVYYFEQIIRGVLQDSSFALPYWDYLQGPVAALSIPPEFTDQASPLYMRNRNTWVNQGQRIDLKNPGALNLGAFKYAYYISTDGSTGFCPTLNNNPHGLVHDFTGDGTNMGNVPTAANDPVFWLHHCNIDRLWASWNNMGYVNPGWGTTRLFPFANAQGKRVDVLLNNATSTGQLGYKYDTYQKVPGAKLLRAPLFLKTPPLAATAGAPAEHHGGVTLSASAPTVLKLAASPRVNSGNLLAAAPPAKGGGVFLALSGVTADEAFGGTYNVYVGLPEGATPGGTDSLNYVGTFGSFNLVGHEHDPAAGPSLVFDITDKAAELTAKGQLPASPSVTFAPQGEITKPPSVASVSIVTV